MAPAIWLLATPQGQVIVALVLLGMAKSVRIWLNPLIDAMTHKSSFLGIVLRRSPLGLIVKGVNWVNHKTAHALSHHAVAHTAPLARYTQGIAHRTRAVNAAHINFADATAYAMYRQRHVVIPTYVRARVRPVMRAAVAAGATADLALHRWKQERAARQRSISLTNRKLGALALGFLGIDYLVKRQHAKAHRFDHQHTIPRHTSLIGRTVRQVRQLARRLSRVESKVTQAAIAAAVTLTLIRNIPSWRCNSFRNIRRQLKCSHWRWLEQVLFGAFALLAVVDPVKIAKAAILSEAAMNEIVTKIAELNPDK